MIRETENVASKTPGRRPALQYRVLDWNTAVALINRFACEPPSQRVSDWVGDHIIFNEPEVKGAFDFTGRNYLRQWLDDNNDASVAEQTIVSATGMGKTIAYLAGMGYKIVHKQPRVLWVMPATNGANGVRNFNKTRLLPMCRATEAIADKMPTGADRFDVSGLHIRMAGTVIDFAGANSPGQLTGNRCSDIRLDEVDKFKATLGTEAGAAWLARTRADGVIGAQIFNASTPTVETGPVWQSLMASNLCRQFLPCPHCGRHHPSSKNFVIVWNEQFSVLPNKFFDGREIPLAKVRWDKEAKRKDGTWDIDRVVRSARTECPHCGGHVLDSDMAWCDENGIWRPTRPDSAANRHCGYQLPAMYAPRRGFDSTFGGMAKKFLEATESPDGMRGFINSVLAEVDVAQEHGGQNIIEISDNQPRTSSVLWWTELSADRQAKYPGFWYRVRRWIVSILRAQKTVEQQASFLKELPGDQKTLCEKLVGPLIPPKDLPLYSPHWILANIQRADFWPLIAGWLIGNGLVETKLSEFFQVEFQSDLIRLLDFICKQSEVNITPGRQGDSECLEFGSADSWEELDEVQRRHNIANPDVTVDARFGALDNAEVYAECFRRCPPQGFCYFAPMITPFGPRGRFSKTPMPGGKPFAEWGWTPVLGYPEHKQWPSKEKIRLPYVQEVNDPFIGKMEARQFYQFVFKFDAQWALSELARIRKRYSFTLAHGMKFMGTNSAMQPVGLPEYNLHMKGYYWDDKEQRWEAPGKRGGGQSRTHPNHGYDCEKNGAARAVWKGVFRYEKQVSERPEKQDMRPWPQPREIPSDELIRQAGISANASPDEIAQAIDRAKMKRIGNPNNP
jgi:hypothetical protein